MQNNISDTPNQLEAFTQPEEILDPLTLNLDEDEIVRTVKSNIKSSIEFYKKKKLYKRQEANVNAYLGNQKLFSASSKSKEYKENIIYEGLSRQKPIELSRMPDLTVKPGDDTPESKKSSEQLSGVFNSDIKKRSNRKLLGLVSKLEPLYFFSVVKARWNAEKGLYGDYEFIHVHPNNIVFDHNCYDNDANKMRFVAEKAKLMLKEVIMMFPDKEEEIKEEFGWEENCDNNEKKMASPINIWEVWFHWYKLNKGESERIDGTIWIYGNAPLKSMRNPYFDYQGKPKLFDKRVEEKNEYTMDDIFGMIDAGKEEKDEDSILYNNYFDEPEKPYYFMVYENMGEHPISETSRIEQVLEFQDIINMDGSVISDMNLRSRGKDIFDTNAIPQPTLEEIDIYDIEQVIGLDVPQGSSMGNVHSRIEQSPATPQQYKSMSENRQKAFEMIGVGATTRGLRENDSTLGQDQMAREADYGVIDDIVEDTINACAEWQARWAMQFIKLFYTKPHLRHILGKDGDVLHTRLTRDIVDDGMEAIVSASGVDKQMRKRMAMENMKLGVGDPLSYYEDTEQSNPKERALRAMMVQGAPMMYMQQYLIENEQAMAQPQEQEPVQEPQPQIEGQQPQQPQQPQVPMGGGGEAWKWYANSNNNNVL